MSAVLKTEVPPTGRAGFELRARVGCGDTVRLSWGPAVGDATGAAVALRDDAAWIGALEDWLAPEDGLDWRPADAPAYSLAYRSQGDWVHATVAGQGRAPRLALPWSLLRRLPAPPEVLGLRWPCLDAELLLTRQSLPPESLAGIAIGSVLLMEASFAGSWPISLRRLGDVDGHGDRDADVDMLEVRMTLPDPLPVPVLAGWVVHARHDTPPQLDAPLRLHRCGASDALLAEGHPLPWGRGQAMRITRLPDTGDAQHSPSRSHLPSPTTAAPRP